MNWGLIGEKLTHSYSKLIHENISNIKYELTPLNNEEFDSFMKNRAFSGINVTIPYKEKVIPYLDYVDKSAKSIGAVNTIVNKDGKLIGYNTDAYGFEKMLKFHEIDVRYKKVLILGTGGTSKTVKSVLIKLKAKEIYFVSRRPGKDSISYEEAQKKFDINVIINTTPNGMYPHEDDESLLELKPFPYLEAVVDVIYNPFRTNIVIEAKEKGIKYCTGLYMLVAQGIRANELFLDTKYDKEIYRKVYYMILRETTNFVFIGMPASGKSTASKNISEVLKKDRYDVDEEIEKDTGLKVKEIFAKYGEQYFRDLEEKKIKELSQLKGIVISLGGGSLLRKNNIYNVLRNGYLIFLNRDIELIKRNKNAKNTRPLLQDENAIDRLYKERFNTYHTYADLEFANNSTKLHTLNYILRRII